jgi:hypothetical protein
MLLKRMQILKTCLGSHRFASSLKRHDPSTAALAAGCRGNSGFDLYRVKFEVNNVKPFACLAFPQTTYLKTPRKQPIFGDELVTSFCTQPLPPAFSARTALAQATDTEQTQVTASQDIVSRNETLSAPFFREKPTIPHVERLGRSLSMTPGCVLQSIRTLLSVQR